VTQFNGSIAVRQSFEYRLEQEEQRLKEQASKLKPGPERDAILKKVRQIDTARHINEWASSPGLQSPK
jgi:cell division protein FtsB